MADSIIPAASTRWAQYRIGYHLVWLPKYRRKILTGQVAETARTSIEQACADADISLLAFESDVDHIHAFVSARPAMSPADVARILKGASSRAIRKHHPDVAKLCGPRELWTQSYYIGTVGDMSAETVRHYIEHCQGQ